MLRLYGIQKQLLINFLSRFTNDLFTFGTIVKELEDFQSLLEECAFIAEGLHKKEGVVDLIQSGKKEDQLLQLFDALPALIGFMRRDKTLGYVNTAYADFFYIKKEETVGKGIKKIIGEEAYKNLEVYIERALEGETVQSISEGEFSGSKKRFKTTLVPKKENDVVEGVFFLVEDLTESKENLTETEGKLQQLEQNLQEVEKKNLNLQRINNELENFVYTASHDLRTPVSNMEGLLQILRNMFIEKANEEEVLTLKMTELATGRLKKTLDDLLDVIVKVQKEESREAVEREKVRFQEVIKEVKEDIHSLILKNHVLIVEDFKIEEIIYPKAKLRSIIYNLLSNAAKYGSPDRPLLIEVTTYEQDDFVVLSVKDNGLGLSFEQLKNLFGMFNRMHGHVEGIGVGLYSIKRMVESSGGKIDVKSEEGKGSEFLVYLPNRR